MYTLIRDTISTEIVSVKRLTDNVFIPFDEGNRDYQEYLKWVAEGNEAEEWVAE